MGFGFGFRYVSINCTSSVLLFSPGLLGYDKLQNILQVADPQELNKTARFLLLSVISLAAKKKFSCSNIALPIFLGCSEFPYLSKNCHFPCCQLKCSDGMRR